MTGMARMLSAILMLVVLVAVGCGGNGDEAVAVVNDEEIQRAELDARVSELRSFYDTQGMELDDQMVSELEQQVLNGIINELLLVQHAARAGFTRDSAPVEAGYQEIAGSFEDPAQFEEALSAQGLTQDELRDALAVQEYVEQELDTEVTDADVQALYDEYAAGTEGMPPLDEVRPLLEDELQRRRQDEFLQGLVEQLRASAEIEVFI